MDIETHNEKMKYPNRRSRAAQAPYIIRDFFIKLDQFLNENPNLKEGHRKILELFSEGKYIKGNGGIAKSVGYSCSGTYKVINQYKLFLMKK